MIDRYINVWKRIVGYIFRTEGLDNIARPLYEFTPEQVKALAWFQRNIRQPTERTMTKRAVAEIRRLDRACLDFLITLLDHQLPQSSYDSVLLSALAAIGIWEDGGWL